MSWQDRSYNQEGGGIGGMGRGGLGLAKGPGGRSVVMWLLIINVLIFLADGVSGWRLREFGNYNLEQGLYGFQVWRWVSYQFLHGGLGHLFGNMLGLYFFGSMMEQWWGSRRFLAFYLLCGICGAVVMTGLSFIPGVLFIHQKSTLVGASGSIFGILAGAAVLFPHQRVMMIIPPIPMSIRAMALFYMVFAFLAVAIGAENAGGQAAHLGGALLGFLLVKHPRVLDWADRVSPSAIQHNVNKGRFERKRKQELAGRAEIDRILDKVRDKGLASLTRKEKKLLSDETERQNRAG